MNIEDENNVYFLLNTIWFKSQIVPTVYVQMDLSNPICNWKNSTFDLHRCEL
jgi:hypothetical protein